MVGFNVFKLTCVLFLLGNIGGCQISPSIKQATTQDSKPVAVQQSTDAEQLYDLYEQANTAGDQVQALQYLTQAAKQGHLSAMVHLAEAYQDGRYGINDDAQALTLLNTAAEQGSVRAMTDLGITFFKGLGVSKDLVKAQDWFQRATTLGDMKAPRYLGQIYQQEGKLQNTAKAFQYNQLAANRGDITGAYQLATLYEQGIGVKQDYQAALQWYAVSAQRGDIIAAPAMLALGRMYEHGLGVTQDFQHALLWYQKAAQAGDQTAQEKLAILAEHH